MKSDAPVLYRFDNLAQQELIHGISLSCGGVSHGAITGLNLGHTVGDALDAVEANHALLYAALGIAPEQVITAHQVHGAQVAAVGPEQAGTIIPSTDGLISNTPGIYLLMRFADCVPVLFFDPARQAIGLAHAGWRGALARVAARTATAMVHEYGCHPEDILAAIGPSIGPCCYEVGPEVVEAVHTAFPQTPGLIDRTGPSGHAYLNLWAVVRAQLYECGLEYIETARLCTACRSDLFYSYRRQGTASGRFGAIIGLRPSGV